VDRGAEKDRLRPGRTEKPSWDSAFRPSRLCFHRDVPLERVNYDVERAIRRLRESGLLEEVVTKMSAVLRHAGRG